MKKILNLIIENYGYIISFLIGALVVFIALVFYFKTPSVKYDVNNDGYVSLADATKIINYYLGKDKN